MKIKKIASICIRTGRFVLFDRISKNGEITQWLGDGSAAYPLDGLPILDGESLCAIFDIPEKKWEKILFHHSAFPETVNVDDIAQGERQVEEAGLSVVHGGRILKLLKTQNGITFIQSQYLQPLEDVLDMVQLFERQTQDGNTYIVAKAGLLTVAVMFPYDAINKEFVEQMEDLTAQCRWELRKKEQQNIHQTEPDDGHDTDFDEEAGRKEL